MAASSSQKFQVFVSHAGEDKATIAIPLRSMLREKGISAFVDEKDMAHGSDAKKEMISAMETADIGVMVMSPEFIAREWPMKELLCFLRRREEALSKGESYPVIIPVFYRLSISELHQEPQFQRKSTDGKSLYRSSRFFERMERGEPEADVQIIKDALSTLHGIMGVRNDFVATNGSEYVMSIRREVLLQATRDSVLDVLRKKNYGDPVFYRSGEASNNFRSYYPPFEVLDAVLDFNDSNQDGKLMTPEACIKKRILERNTQSPRVVSILGIGGVGKSTILKGLANDNDIRSEFCDGVHTISLGMQATHATLMQEICKVLRNSGAMELERQLHQECDLSDALREAVSWFESKRCAFLIDDAWSRNIGMALFSSLCKLAGLNQQNAVIFTTREHEIASLGPRGGIMRVHPRKPRGTESRRILFLHAEVTEATLNSEYVRKLVSEVLDMCDGLPVSIAAAGKGVKMLMIDTDGHEEIAWNEYVINLRVCREQLIEEHVGDYGNLYATLRASVILLDKKQENKVSFGISLGFSQMHRRLCVLRKQDKAPSSMLKYLWEAQSDGHARVIGMQFVQVGLASLAYELIGSTTVWNLRLHDSIHDFSICEARIHGEVYLSHVKFLEGYRLSEPRIWSEDEQRMKWWSEDLKKDGYIHRNLCRHLREAARVLELVKLLKTPEWIMRQIEVNGMSSIDEDLALGIEAAYYMSKNEIIVLQLLREALGLSFGYVAKNTKELPFQLSGRLMGYRDAYDGVEHFLCRLERNMREPWLRILHDILERPGGGTTKKIPIGKSAYCMTVQESENWAALGCEGGKVAIVNLIIGEVQDEWSAHNHSVVCIASTKEGKRIVTGSSDGSVKVWDSQTGTCLAVFRGHARTVDCVGITSCGHRVTIASKSGTVQMWDTQTRKSVTSFSLNEFCEAIAVFPDAEQVLSFGPRGTLPLPVLRRNMGLIVGRVQQALVVDNFLPTSTIISSRMLRLWNIAGGLEIGRHALNHFVSSATMHIAVSCNGQRILTLQGREVKIWSVELKNSFSTKLSNGRYLTAVRCICISDDGARIAYGSLTGTIRVQETTSDDQVGYTCEGHTEEVSAVSFVGSNDRMVSSSLDGHVRIWDLSRISNLVPEPQEETNTASMWTRPILTFSGNGNRAVSYSRGQLCVWDKTVKWKVGEPVGDETVLTAIAASYDGRRVISISPYKILQVWDLDKRKQSLAWRSPSTTFSVALTSQGDYAVAGSPDGTVHVWKLTAPKQNHFVLKGHGYVYRVLSSEDGQHIISAEKETIMVWDIDSRQLLKQVRHDQAKDLSVRCIMEFAGERIEHARAVPVTVSGREVRYGRGEITKVLGTLEREVAEWAVSPDQKTLCVGFPDGNIAFMKIETPSEHQEPSAPGSQRISPLQSSVKIKPKHHACSLS